MLVGVDESGLARKSKQRGRVILMADASSGTATQADAATQPQAGTTSANPQAGAATQSSQSQPTSSENEPLSLDEAKKLRQEHAALRKRLKEYDDAKAQADAANMTDIERTTKELNKHKQAVDTFRTAVGQLSVELEAQKLGIVDPEVAATLIAAKLEYGEDGRPTNAADLLKELVKNKPYLAAQAGSTPAAPPMTAGGATNPSRTSTNGGAKIPLSWDYIGYLQLHPDEYKARQPEIQQWMIDNIRSRPRR